jgi:hypothetical protein
MSIGTKLQGIADFVDQSGGVYLGLSTSIMLVCVFLEGFGVKVYDVAFKAPEWYVGRYGAWSVMLVVYGTTGLGKQFIERGKTTLGTALGVGTAPADAAK